jgi:lactate dehydrogenase-like 2-hydroxyacid dehydrogenase
MNEAVVISEAEFSKGAASRAREELPVRWIPTPPEEASVARAVREAGARIAVLGALPYHGELYEALRDAAGGRGALIARFGVGYDGIDTALCRDHGILLTITPGALDLSVAEHAMALLLSLTRRVPELDRGVRGGAFTPHTGRELAGRTLCVAGLGSIGGRVARMASAGFSMRVIGFGRRPLADRCRETGDTGEGFLARHGLDGYGTDWPSAAGRADAISIHMPAGPATRNFFDAGRLACLPPHAFLINTSRGSLVDETALFHALSAGRLAGAGLDVFAREPYVPADPACDLRTLEQVVLTPHAGSDTAEANGSMQRLVSRNIAHFLQGRTDLMDTVGKGVR